MTAAETPVLDTLADITAISLERCALPPRELMLTRIAALIAVDAPPASYMANAGAAADIGITGDDVQAIMIGIAPVVGTTRAPSPLLTTPTHGYGSEPARLLLHRRRPAGDPAGLAAPVPSSSSGRPAAEWVRFRAVAG